jgi:amino acid adenylation domain-containing protein
VLLAVTTLSFDIAALELLLPLVRGARVVLANRADAVDPGRLASLLARHEVTVMQATPATWRLLVAGGWPGDPRLKALCGGEALAGDLAQALAPRVAALWNLYGPTETTVWSTCGRVFAGDLAPAASAPLGRPIAATRIHLLDACREPLPVGVVGELWIGGAGVARGYLGRPGLTDERFIDDPFAPAPGARLYRTGDLARRDAAGTLHYVGRNDDQLKLRGFRIEPGEIEARLRANEGVRDAAVVVRPGPAGEEQLVAYVVPHEGAAPCVEALRAALAAALPAHMRPQRIVALPALPLTPNGKVDRRALPAPPAAGTSAATQAAPAGALQETVAAVWVQVLGLERVDADDNFFDLGGHSLLAVRVAGRLRAALGRAVEARAIFEAPTVARLAERLAQTPAEDEAPAPLRPRGPDVAPQPTFAQERLWFVQSLEDAGSTTWNLPVSARLHGPLDPGALHASLQDLVARHEGLRSRFVGDGAGVRVEIVPQLALPLPVQSLDAAAAARRVEAHARTVFDLARGPLLAAEVLALGPQAHLLLLNVHHIVADGWSLRVIFDQWMRLYDARVRGLPDPLPAPRVQVADVALAQRAALAGPAFRQGLAYWTTQLRGAPELLALPADRARPAVQRIEGAELETRIDRATLARLHALARAADASLFMALLAAYALLLGRLAGEEDVVIGTPLAHRDRPELEDLVGLFAGHLALRTDLSGAPSFRTLLARVRRTTLDAFAHADVPFERIVDGLGLRRDLSRHPVFQACLNLMNLPPAGFAPAGLVVEELVGTRHEARHDLTLYAEETHAGLALRWVYDRALFDAPRVAEMARQFARLLTQVTAAPDAAVTSHDLVTDAARVVLPDPAAPLPDAWVGAVHELFERQAARRPEALAIESHERTWRYRELSQHSERIACWLQARGIVRGDVVALHAARDAALAAAILGVLKAGAAFALIDPAHPPAHARACIAAARPRAWLQVAPQDDAARALAASPGIEAVLVLQDVAEHLELQALAGRSVRRVGLEADDLALIAFTSGSTGAPKAVEARHGPLTHFLPWTSARFGFGEGDRWAMLSALGHDPLQRDLFNALCLGGTLVVPHVDTFSPRRLAQWLSARGVTAANLTPALARLLAEDTPASLDALRHVFLVGDALAWSDVARLQSVAPNTRVVNLYGATETQRALGYFECAPGVRSSDLTPYSNPPPHPATTATVPAGTGMPGCQLLVLTARGAPAGIGEPGEIHVRSPHLARGYRDDPALTARRFLRNPFTDAPADRLYATGDVGRHRLDGGVDVLGRRDTQVKVRGYRVELGAIESALRDRPDVREAAAVVHGEGVDDRRIVAYVVPKSATEGVNTGALRNALRAHLPAYMLPAAIVVLERLPLTPNGKLARAALPTPAATRGDAPFVAPRTPTEARLAAIWAGVLQVEAVGVADNFFDSGGHSLRAAQAVARIRDEFGVDLPLRRLFETPTVAALADLIDADSRPFDEIEL